MAKRKQQTFEMRRDQFVKSKLRQASIRWPEKNEAKKASRVERGLYQCAQCKEGFRGDQVQLDHVEPVVSITQGFTNWDDYINRLFIPASGYQVLCEQCHMVKTLIEDATRANLNQNKKRANKKFAIAKKEKKE
jgi:5-methylcytosine-specific restriction endonuclease McrA